MQKFNFQNVELKTVGILSAEPESGFAVDATSHTIIVDSHQAYFCKQPATEQFETIVL